VDGGYFENSGMLSLMNYYEYISNRKIWKDSLSNYKVVFIQIMNGKSDQINELVKSEIKSVKETAEAGEISSVIGTITGIAGLPRYINKKAHMNPDISYVPIYLPYKIKQEDLEKFWGAKELNQCYCELLNTNKCLIENIRQVGDTSIWVTAPPPLARLMNEPELNYMMGAIYRGNVFDSLNALKPE
jgi:hypothetical protein